MKAPDVGVQLIAPAAGAQMKAPNIGAQLIALEIYCTQKGTSMFVHVPSHTFMSGQTDDRINLPLPMVYENVPVELPRWEYRVLKVDTREEALPDGALLDELGMEGWSLVGVLEQKTSGNGAIVHYYFIRQKM